jgi:hypothetical protein
MNTSTLPITFGRSLSLWPRVAVAILFVTAGGMASEPSTRFPKITKLSSDPYYQVHGGWENRPLESALKQGRLVFQSDFSDGGLERDWKADGVIVERRDGAVVLSVAPERLETKKCYGALWAKTPFPQPLMIEVECTLDPSAPHDANVYWGQKEPSCDELGKEQECFIMGYFGWGGRCCGFEGTKCGGYGISGAVEPKVNTRFRGVWIIQDKQQCLYLDNTLVVRSNTPTPPPANGLLGLAVYQSKVIFHSLKVYSLAAKKG